MEEYNDNIVNENEEGSEDPEINTSNSHPVQPATLGKGQKIAAIFLAFFAFLVIIIWINQFSKSISGPLSPTENSGTNLANFNIEENSDELLKSKDTDGDGLTDWDELNVYQTSPYLEDSDSDGFFDGDEINSGNDPNCPSGRDCYVDPVENNNADIEDPSPNPGQEVNETFNDINIESENDETLQDLLSGQTDAQGLRDMLLNAGMDKELLDAISDEELINIYSESLSN